MGKEELQRLNEVYDLMKNLENQMNFLQVQVASGGGRSSGKAQTIPSVGAGIDPKQLQALEQRLDNLLEIASRNNEALFALRDEITKLVSGKIEAADERMNQVTRLLEQGLQFTEMGTHLTEIKDRLEEVIVELAASSKDVASTTT